MNPSFQWLDYTVLIIYLLAMLVIGFLCSRRNTSTDHFFVGSRAMPWWAVGISIFATQLSAITFISIPGKVFESDMSWLIMNLGIPLVGLFVAIYFLPVFFQKSYTSIYEILEERFGIETRVFGAIAYILIQFGRVAVVLYLPALALAEVTGLPVTWMILCMGILVTVYTVLGGIEVVIWTDVLQAIILFGGAVLALFIMAGQTEGGFAALNAVANENQKFQMVHTDPAVSNDLIWYMLIGAFFANLVPYASDQTVVQRYFTTKNMQEARRCLYLGVLIAIPASLLFFYLGSMLFAFYHLHPELFTMNPTESGYDRIFPFFIVHQLPAGLSGLLIAAIFAGSMSSLDSSLNSVATVCVRDFYQRFHNPNSTDQQRLVLARWITIILGAFAIFAALGVSQLLLNQTGEEDQQVSFGLFMALNGLLGGTLAGIFCAGILTKRANQIGAVAGMVIGTAVLTMVRFELEFHTLTLAAVGVVVSFTVTYVVSLITTTTNSVESE